MGIDLRLRYDSEARRRAVELHASGMGRAAIARALGASEDAVRQWVSTYGSVGMEGLLAMGAKKTFYGYETKLAAARAVVDGGLAKPEAMRRFGVASAAPLKRWCRLYREGGAEALRPKPKGRPRGAGAKGAPMTREQELEERVRKLEAQVAYLKKFRALASRDPR